MSTPSFRFGKNWQTFNDRYLDEERLALSKKSLLEFLKVNNLEGKTFIDVGAGSGLFSLAALQLGATEVVSIDIDEESIGCCRQLKERQGSPENWRIIHGSALDDVFIGSLGHYDVVYSWGVLHHTGQMWHAIEHVLQLVKPGGLFFLAIYNKADGLGIYPDLRMGPSSFWRHEKKFYVSLPYFLQNLIDYTVMSTLILCYILTLRNPVHVIHNHKNYSNKGMSWRIDIKDWLGGYPYEYATVAEIFTFMKQRGCSLENLTCNNGLLNNQFLFKKN